MGVFLSLGANLGDCMAALKEAARLINGQIGPVVGVSSVYSAAAWGNTLQPSFLNQVLHVQCRLPPEEVLTAALQIEAGLGRVRKIKWGPRTMDIDILYYGHIVFNSGTLIIPHPHIAERRFVLVPMAELAPDFVHPVFHKTQNELLEACADKLEVVKVAQGEGTNRADSDNLP